VYMWHIKARCLTGEREQNQRLNSCFPVPKASTQRLCLNLNKDSLFIISSGPNREKERKGRRDKAKHRKPRGPPPQFVHSVSAPSALPRQNPQVVIKKTRAVSPTRRAKRATNSSQQKRIALYPDNQNSNLVKT
jgi:hypothetical protein